MNAIDGKVGMNGVIREIRRMRPSIPTNDQKKTIMTQRFYYELLAELKRTTMLTEMKNDDPYRGLPLTFSGLPIEIVNGDGSWFEVVTANAPDAQREGEGK